MNRFNQKIDIIYTWVNGDFPGCYERMSNYAQQEGDVNPERFRDEYDLLRYSLRSLEKYVSWINHIYIFTQKPQVPDWLNQNHPKIKIVHHEDVIDPEYLPTFNSNVIESYLHKIPELSEYFLYMNDDFFFGRETEIDKFISQDGVINVFGTLFGENLSWRIYQKKNDIIGLGLIEHCPLMMKREHWQAMYEIWPDKIHEQRLRKFRQTDDIMAHKLYRYYMLKYQPQISRPVKLWELKKWQIFHKITNSYKAQKKGFARLARVKPHFYCLNDDQGRNPNPDVITLVQDYLKRTYPKASSFENL